MKKEKLDSPRRVLIKLTQRQCDWNHGNMSYHLHPASITLNPLKPTQKKKKKQKEQIIILYYYEYSRQKTFLNRLKHISNAHRTDINILMQAWNFTLRYNLRTISQMIMFTQRLYQVRALTLSISEIATVLLIACPIAFNTMSSAPFS